MEGNAMTCQECGKEFPKIDSMPRCWECWWKEDDYMVDNLEWVRSAENEPDEDDAWWARMLTEGEDQQC
jgi:hypothetical protein